jgi:hypothetical protein
LLPPDFEEDAAWTYLAVRPFTMTTPERVYALVRAVEHVVARGVSGAVVECGVWRGGSMMAAALTLLWIGAADRELFLFDTFDGMTAPTAEDGEWERREYRRLAEAGEKWVCSPFDGVARNLASTGYPAGLIRYVAGRVEDKLPAEAPDRIAILRLDTDFYESTRHELEHLYPLLAPGGLLIVDDYGSFRGARRAVDEYICDHHLPLFLTRIDSDARIAVKT